MIEKLKNIAKFWAKKKEKLFPMRQFISMFLYSYKKFYKRQSVRKIFADTFGFQIFCQNLFRFCSYSVLKFSRGVKSKFFTMKTKKIVSVEVRGIFFSVFGVL